MATRNWTQEQTTAINMRDRTILLSAAAGSGKTAVLTERTIRALTDEENPLDLGRLLAVTFTRAAARELRERIAAALAEEVKNHPTDARLARQLRLLPTAKICTIDSFCGDLVRRNATRAGVSEGYRVADQQETDLARIALMEGLIEDAYHGLVPDLPAEEFSNFVTRLYALREESSMGETLLSLFERMETLEGGVDTLAMFSAAYRKDAETPLMETTWGKTIRKVCGETAAHFLRVLDTAEVNFSEDTKKREKDLAYMDLFRDIYTRLASPAITYESIMTLTAYKFPAAPSGFGDRAPALKASFDEFKKKYLANGKIARLVTYTEAEWKTLFADLAHATDVLWRLAREFSRRETKESRRRGVYSFAQIERLAYNLLIENGERTPLAISLSKEYDAVSVDEYQDVSPLQHAVFAAIAEERSRFLVGDIKQSIYRFRHADPSIFASLRRAFPSPTMDPDSPAATLFMSLNFRCDPPIVAYVNQVFDVLFGQAGESIGYTSADRLGCGKQVAEGACLVTPMLAVFESTEDGMAAVSDGAALTNGLPDAAHVAGGEKNPLPDTDADEEGDENEADIHAEAMWVAGTIRELLDSGTRSNGERIKPSDIAILLRAKRNKVVPYIEALLARGIPAETPEATDFFSCPEVLLALSLLRAIDNPRRDISLAATLLSPLYRFSADDLTLIRGEAPDGIPLYDALVSYCDAHPDFEKGQGFLRQLASFRSTAEDASVDHLLRRIMSETPLLSISGADGEGGENKIRLLYHYALRFEGGSSGLYSFIHYINRQIEPGKTFTPPSTPGEVAGVSVMTIHSSKGLEFPVVFVADCGKQFSNLDALDHFVFDGTHPLAFRLRDESGLIRVENPVRHIVTHTLAEENAEEEMRLLYVALTRAKERLYISGTLPKGKTVEDALNEAKQDAAALSRFTVMRRNSYLSLLLLAHAVDGSHVILSTCPLPPESNHSVDSTDHNDFISESGVAAFTAELRRRFGYTYPNAYLTHIPGKLSVSRLTPTLLDGTEGEAARLDPPADDTTPPLHADIETTCPEEHEKYRRMPEAWTGVHLPDPTEKGIVSHQFMQFCDFDRLAKEGIQAEMQRLLSLGYLSEADAALVRPEELEMFRTSSLLALMRRAREVKREFRFHAHLPAARFATDPALRETLGDEMLLVQGVMDAVVIDENGEITLIDYKTDRFTREELRDRRLAAAKMQARHAPQLRYYAAAVERIFGKKPIRTAIYALHLGDTIDLCLD